MAGCPISPLSLPAERSEWGVNQQYAAVWQQ